MNQTAAPSNPPPPAVDPAAAPTPPWVDIYLNELGTHFQASRALLAAGINYHILAEYRHVSESFAAKEARCQSCLGEFLQSEVIRRSTAVPELNAQGRRIPLSPPGGDRLLIRLLDFIVPGFRPSLPSGSGLGGGSTRRASVDPGNIPQFKDRLSRQEQALSVLSLEVKECNEDVRDCREDLSRFHDIVFCSSPTDGPIINPSPDPAIFHCARLAPPTPAAKARNELAKLDRRHHREVHDLHDEMAEATQEIDRIRAINNPNCETRVKILATKIHHLEQTLRHEIADYTETAATSNLKCPPQQALSLSKGSLQTPLREPTPPPRGPPSTIIVRPSSRIRPIRAYGHIGPIRA